MVNIHGYLMGKRGIVVHDMIKKVLKGVLFSFQIGMGAKFKKSLSASGVVGAMLVGTTCYAFGGPVFYHTLLAFFSAGSVITHYRKKEKEQVPVELQKGGERDIFQVLANGGVGALCVLLYYFSKGNPLFLYGYLGSMAAVSADTWATEIGLLSRTDPVHIMTGEPVAKGTSGGITPAGNLAAIAGALVPGLVAVCCQKKSDKNAEPAWAILGCSLLGGLAGAFLDSLLGATVQAQYICPHCNKHTEKRVHGCGEETRLQRGVGWIHNDMVNVACALTGATVGVLFFTLLKELDRGAEELEYFLTL